jgi:uncharacterized damage-inducible protein DinB
VLDVEYQANDPQSELHRYLQLARDAMLWKLEGISEYDARRPLVPTGTNLLGLVKHVASVEAGYLGTTFGRPFPELPPGEGPDDDPSADMWATGEETRGDIVDLYHRVWEHADTTISELPLEAIGRVPWWPQERAEVNLHRILIHVIAETNRHAGHADILRETIDGFAGLRADNNNLWQPVDGWTGYHERLEQLARRFR